MNSATTQTARAWSKWRPAHGLLKLASAVAPELRPGLQRLFIRVGYAIVNRSLNAVEAGCMNFGYAALDADAPVSQASGNEVYGHQLYARVASTTSIQDREALEVGCGRGGGAAFVTEHFGLARLTGLDFSRQAIAFARARHTDRRLHFVQGDAEDLPFADASFDVVLNVESSHCYPSVPRFAAEAFRVLRPGGHLLLADLRPRADVDDLRRLFLDAGFESLEEERITPNVVRALELDSPRRVEFVRQRVPRLLQSHVLNFAATSGSEVYEALRAGDLEYVRYAMVKTAGAPAQRDPRRRLA